MRRRKKNRFGIGFVFLTMFVLFAAISIKKGDLVARNNELQEEKERCEEELAALNEEQNDIEEYRDYVNSDEYIEDIARKKLGLIYPDEIIFEADE